MSNKEEVIGKRAKKVKVMNAFMFMIIIMYLVGIPCSIILPLYGYYEGIIAIAMVVFASILFVPIIVGIIKSNKNSNPTITLRSDGVFVIHRPNGTTEPITDKILEVTAKPHHKKSGAGESFGAIVFKVEKATKQTTIRIASFVVECEEVTKRINDILAKSKT